MDTTGSAPSPRANGERDGLRGAEILRSGAFILLALAAGVMLASPSRAQTAPRYEADINWPKPLPERWILGGLGGNCVDAKGHVLILNRQDLFEGDLHAAQLAPPVIEFDPEGNVVNAWGDLKLMDPRLHSCHFDMDGNIWVASAPSGMVQKYTRDGKRLLLQIGIKGKLDSSDGTAKGKPLNSPAATFFMPSSIFVDRTNGDVYVSDGEGAGTNRRVAVFDSTGKFLRQWVMEDMGNVHCMTIANDGAVYVCNRRGSSVRVYDKARRELLFSIPRNPADEKSLLLSPTNIAIDREGRLYVSDTGAFLIQIYDADGAHLRTIGEQGLSPGNFALPKGIAVDREGRVYVVDAATQVIQIFDAEGRILMYFGNPKVDGPGGTDLPAGIAVDYDHLKYFQKYASPDFKVEYLIFITNQYGNHKISVYGFGRKK